MKLRQIIISMIPMGLLLVAKLAIGQPNDIIVSGSGDIAGTNIQHPNGNIFDQVLLTGPSIKLKAKPGQITRVSFLDENDDIVQVEFSGNGKVAVTLDPTTFIPSATASKYNQPTVSYVKGRPSIKVEEADDGTFLSIFTVGRLNAVNQSLFLPSVNYDGVADVAFLEISGTGLGSVLAANTRFSDDTGFTGINAFGVDVRYRAIIGDVDARGSSVPMLIFGQGSRFENDGGALLIAGGDLVQSNGENVVVAFTGNNGGFNTIRSQPNVKSDGTLQSAKLIRATFSNLSGQIISVSGDVHSEPSQPIGFAPDSLNGKSYDLLSDLYPDIPETYTFEGNVSGSYINTADFVWEFVRISGFSTGTFIYRKDTNDPNKAFLNVDIEFYSLTFSNILTLSGSPEQLSAELLTPFPTSSEGTFYFTSPTRGTAVSILRYTDGSVDSGSGIFIER